MRSGTPGVFRETTPAGRPTTGARGRDGQRPGSLVGMTWTASGMSVRSSEASASTSWHYLERGHGGRATGNFLGSCVVET